jgi:CDP-diacylglycerol---glycerol-3-phosphate 3-phosphatidyltransferase
MDTPTFNKRDLLSPPGLLSLSRVALAICFPFVVARPWLALVTVAVAALSDGLDGYLARKLRMSSPTGAALDPITDKIFATSVMVSLLAQHRLSLGWAALLSLRELLELPLLVWLVTMPRARATRASHLKANWLGKLTTALQFVALVYVLLQLSHVRWWVFATAGCGALAATVYWTRFIKVLTIREHILSRPAVASAGAEASR